MDRDFRDYVTARSATLLRTAYLLTGNHSDAEDLLQDALFKLSIAWPRVHQSESLDGGPPAAVVAGKNVTQLVRFAVLPH